MVQERCAAAHRGKLWLELCCWLLVGGKLAGRGTRVCGYGCSWGMWRRMGLAGSERHAKRRHWHGCRLMLRLRLRLLLLLLLVRVLMLVLVRVLLLG